MRRAQKQRFTGTCPVGVSQAAIMEMAVRRMAKEAVIQRWLKLRSP